MKQGEETLFLGAECRARKIKKNIALPTTTPIESTTKTTKS